MKHLLIFKTTMLCVFVLTTTTLMQAQTWPKLYGASTHKGAYKIHESYDQGYIIQGFQNKPNALFRWSLLMKTDINGEILWEKFFGEPGSNIGMISSNLTSDGGFIISGLTSKYDYQGDPLLMKLNACAEYEWCNIYHIPGKQSYAADVLQMPNGNFIALINYYSFDNFERIWLFCLSPAGEVLWEKVYTQEQSSLYYFNETGHLLTLSSDGNILITADCWMADPQQPNVGFMATLHIMVDADGEELWTELFRESDDQAFSSYPVKTLEKLINIFYTCGVRTSDPVYGHSVATLMKFNSNGVYLDHVILHPTQNNHIATNLVPYDTNHFVVTGSYRIGFEKPHIMLYKSDTLGNILHEKELFRDDQAIQDAILTTDNYVIMTSLHMTYNPLRWKVYINKVDGELNEA